MPGVCICCQPSPRVPQSAQDPLTLFHVRPPSKEASGLSFQALPSQDFRGPAHYAFTTTPGPAPPQLRVRVSRLPVCPKRPLQRLGSAPFYGAAPPRLAHSLVPGRDSTVRKMVKPKAIRCAKIPLPLRSQRVSLGSLAGAGTRPTSMGCMAVPGRPAQSSYQRLLPGLRSRRRRRLQERLLPGDAAGPCCRGAYSALCRVGEKRLGPKGRLPETSTDLIELPTHLHSIFVSVSQEACENYVRSN